MRWFKKRAPRSTEPAIWLVQLRDGVRARQRRLAEALARKTAYWNRESWLVALGLFILVFGGCCLYLCIKIFIH